MNKEELIWTTWYAWYPVLLEDADTWAWLVKVDRAYDPTFIDHSINIYAPYTTIGIHHHRTLTAK